MGRLRDAVFARCADFGFLIDDDGANVAVLDEIGALLAPDDLLSLLAEVLAAEQTGSLSRNSLSVILYLFVFGKEPGPRY